ncbi:unnamed protein product [Ilex paraguariensis]|uniref:Uncharacterized protein n=1 Tax=Ilex paraguariensis TaxID=185542 RepID=A0ABC8UW88_9AQUA
MASPINYAVDEKDLDDAALWAVIDSAAAASLSSTTAISKSRKPLALKHTNNFRSPTLNFSSNPSPPTKFPQNPRNYHNSPHAELFAEPWAAQNHRPHKIARSSCVSELSETSTSPLVVVKHLQRTPNTPMSYSSPEAKWIQVKEHDNSPNVSECSPVSYGQCEEGESTMMRHSLSGRFPTVSLFKEYQNAAMAILEKSDFTMISGSPYIKKVGGRYHSTSIFLMKLKTRLSSLMITVMFSVLSLWFGHRCRVVGSLMDGGHVTGMRRDF